MRIIEEGEAPKPVEAAGDGMRDIDAPPIKAKAKEFKCTCTRCLTKFAFTMQDEGVTIDNEGDLSLECPKCNQPLLVGKVTGIVTQRPFGD